MSFPRYPTYKGSGVEWLGQVPTHWSIKAIKWLSPVLRGASPRPIDDPKYFDDDGEYAWVRIADSSASSGVLTETTQRLSELGSSLSVRLEPGELFVSIAGTVGKPCITAMKACIHDGFVYFPRLNIDPKFLFRVFEAGVCYAGLGKMGTQLNLNTDTIGSIRVALPPPDELPGVLSFIDRETAKIDALVAEQEQLITLLKEKRQAVISHAVTKGLDPSVPMKDSGVEWLGVVPAHWSVSALSYLSSIETGSTPDRGEPRYWNGSIPWLKTGEINWEPIREAEEFITEEGLANSAVKLSRPGTLLMAMYGQGVTRGRVALLEIEATYNQACAAITFWDRVTPEFGRYFFMAAYDHIREGGNETSQMNLSAGLIAKFRLTVPPKVEQVAIVHKLDDELSRLGVLCGEAEYAVRLLQERRSALISAAVTGQIDVRQLV